MKDVISSRVTKLEQRRMSHVETVGRSFYIQHDRDFFTDAMHMCLDAYIWSHKADLQTQTATARVPATWWDHFKLEAIKWGNPFFNPAKIRMRNITLTTQFDIWETYPELVLSPTKNGRAMFLDFDITNTLEE